MQFHQPTQSTAQFKIYELFWQFAMQQFKTQLTKETTESKIKERPIVYVIVNYSNNTKC